MGVRVTFYDIPILGMEYAIQQDMPKLKKWYLENFEAYPEESNEALLDQLLASPDLRNFFPQLSAELKDEFMGLYIGDFCDYGSGHLYVVEDSSCIYFHHYQKDRDWIKGNCSEEALRLWDFMLTGRSLIADKALILEDPVFRFCFLSQAECQLLTTEILLNWGETNSNKTFGIQAFLDAIQHKREDGILVVIA